MSLRRGARGEELAANYLREQGYHIIDRNFHFGRLGELDIIARDGDEIVFVEVKIAGDGAAIEPEYRISKSKQSKLRKAAEGYMWQNLPDQQPCRFDVLAIVISSDAKPQFRHYVNAF
jgi:putative endonuclease